LTGVTSRRTTVLLVVGALSLAAMVVATIGARSGGAGVAAGPAPGVLAPTSPFAGSVVPPGVRTPDLALRDQDGRLVDLRRLRGRPWVVTFLYSRCDESCPPQAQQIKGALDDLGHDVPVIGISVKPEEDTPASAREFLQEVRMTGRMSFLLGSRPELRRAWKGFAIQPQTRSVEHQSRIALIDRDGYQRVGFTLDQATPERIAHDLRLLGA
jgi:protein SCO1/2